MRRVFTMSGRISAALIICVMMILVTLAPPMTETAFAGAQAGASAGEAGAPAGEAGAPADEAGGWAEDIPRMLQAGEYREGVVFAGIDLRKTDDIEDVSKNAEEIMTVDASAAEAAVTGEESPSDKDGRSKVSRREAAAQEDCVSIACIRRKGKTTEQILRELAKDDSVIFAEPDYIMDIQAETGEASSDEALAEAVRASAADAGQAPEPSAAESETAKDSAERSAAGADRNLSGFSDMTKLQWSSSDSATLHAEGVSGGVSINVPNFDTQEGNMDNTVVVAVIDCPVDFTNPDLAPVAYNFSPEEQARLGCDVHGYNAAWQSDDGKLEYWEGGSHGTHCAGIIGAAWDGKGISGVASNVRIISVQNNLADGRTSLINDLRAMAFVKRANEETGAGIRITSNSWGLCQSSRALDAAVRELGEEQGVVSFFSAGNDGKDLGGMDMIVSDLMNNPYAVIVANTSTEGKVADSSSYSDQIVTLGAPGNGILSTMQMSDTTYIPDATMEKNKFYEDFESGAGPESLDVRFTLLDDDMRPVPTSCSIAGREGMGYEGEHALKLGLDPNSEDAKIRVDIDLPEGVAAGDYLGFAFGGVYRSTVGRNQAGGYYLDDTGKWQEFTLVPAVQMAIEGGFGNAVIKIPEGAIHDDALTIAFDYSSAREAQSLYIDSVGIGSRTAPYAMLTGTSMACPAVAGGAAVLASRYPEAKGEELAQLVRSSVRRMDPLVGKTQTGGILDLSVDVAPASDRCPVISSASLEGRTITVEGRHFGDEPGTGTVKRLIPGTSGQDQPVSVLSWAPNKVVLALDGDLEGVAQVSLSAKATGKHDSYTWLVSSSDRVYGAELPLDKGTGEPFVFDGEGDKEACGPLVSLKGKLYFLPAVTEVEQQPAHRSLRVYDTAKKTWTDLRELPVWLENVSAAPQKGKLIVKGTVMQEKKGVPSHVDEPQAAVFAYDPGSDSWTSCSAAKVYGGETLVADGDELLLVGAVSDGKDAKGTVRKYDPASGGGAKLTELKGNPKNPQAAVSRGVLYAYDFKGFKVESVDLNAGAGMKGREYRMPDIVGAPTEGYETVGMRSKRNGVLVPVCCGVLLIGPAAADGSTDTFVLKRGESGFAPGKRRASEDYLLNLAAASDGDRIYVLASAAVEPGGRLFRSEAQENIFDHRWSFTGFEWTGSKAKGYTAARAVYTCEYGVHKKKVNAALTGRVIGATCTKGGRTVYTAAVSAAEASDGVKRTQDRSAKATAAAGHRWDKGRVTRKATPNVTGVKLFTCKKCGAKKIKTMPRTADVLPARGIARGKSSVKISWKGAAGADRYVIYMSRCDGKAGLKRVKTLSGKKLTWKRKGLTRNANYKFRVAAQKKTGGKYKTFRISPVGHFVTGNVNEWNQTNPKSLKVKKKKVTLKKNATFRIKAKVKKVKRGKRLMTNHAARLRFISNDSSVATVSSKGLIRAKKAGVCRIYVLTINGIWKTVTVTVK